MQDNFDVNLKSTIEVSRDGQVPFELYTTDRYDTRQPIQRRASRRTPKCDAIRIKMTPKKRLRSEFRAQVTLSDTFVLRYNPMHRQGNHDIFVKESGLRLIVCFLVYLCPCVNATERPNILLLSEDNGPELLLR